MATARIIPNFRSWSFGRDAQGLPSVHQERILAKGARHMRSKDTGIRMGNRGMERGNRLRGAQGVMSITTNNSTTIVSCQCFKLVVHTIHRCVPRHSMSRRNENWIENDVWFQIHSLLPDIRIFDIKANQNGQPTQWRVPNPNTRSCVHPLTHWLPFVV